MAEASGRAAPGPEAEDVSELALLARGDTLAWNRFTLRWSPVIHAAVKRLLDPAGRGADIEDVAQEVFVRLIRAERPLAGYDPARSALSTFLTVLATSAAIDHLRRQRPTVPVEILPERYLALAPPEPRLRLAVPERLLSPRQALVMALLYDRDMEVAEVAHFLKIEPQTVRSLHHKALARLRAFFGPNDGAGDAKPLPHVSRRKE